MFDEIQGLPAHPLLVHAAVVFVPLLVLGSVAYALVPGLRRRIGWAVALLAVAAPIFAFVAWLSGEELQQDMIERGYPPAILDQVAEHQRHGDRTWWLSLGLGIVTGILLLVTRRRGRGAHLPSWITPVLVVIVLALAGLTAVYVVLAGDSGARAAWGGF